MDPGTLIMAAIIAMIVLGGRAWRGSSRRSGGTNVNSDDYINADGRDDDGDGDGGDDGEGGSDGGGDGGGDGGD